MNMKKESFFEKAAGSALTSSAVAMIAASSGSFLAPLLPVLTGKLASDRYRKRMENALQDVNQKIQENEEKLNELTDSQFKLLNEGITAMLHTVDDEKIAFLKNAIRNTLDEKDLEEHCSIILSRVLRDISVPELRFLTEVKNYTKIIVSNKPENSEAKEDGQLRILANSDEAALLSGLVYLNLAAITVSGYGEQ
jgi:hypothetical protein